MDPTIIDLLTASDDDDLRAKAQMMAQSLRGGRDIGTVAQLGGKRAAGFGRGLMSDADAEEKGMLAAGIANQGNNFKQQKLIGEFDKALAVQEARNKGAYDLAQLRALTAAGKPEKPPKAMPFGEMKYLDESNNNLRLLKQMSGDFKDEYSGGVGKALTTGIAQTVGGSAPEAWRPSAEFWSGYQMLLEIPKRRMQFGTALSANEKQLWERAKKLGPKSDPAVVRRTFQEMIANEEAWLSKHRQARLGVYGADQVDPVTSEVAGDRAAPATKRRIKIDANGNIIP